MATPFSWGTYFQFACFTWLYYFLTHVGTQAYDSKYIEEKEIQLKSWAIQTFNCLAKKVKKI